MKTPPLPPVSALRQHLIEEIPAQGGLPVWRRDEEKGARAKLVELFDAHGVSFVAVTQQFNTTTSMGRLTLNVLLSFAQFERELAGERIRDKFAASRRKGMWMGGNIPLGYDVRDRKLVINEEEADRVRLIFRRYLAVGNVGKLRADLDQHGVRANSAH